MAPCYALEIVDRTLRDLTGKNLPFSGKVIVLGGGFRQLLPIKAHSTRSENVNLLIKFSLIWKCFIKFSLIKNMRVFFRRNRFS